MDLSLTFTVAFVGLALERFLGYPSPLRRLIGHPAGWLYRFTGIFTSVLPGPGPATARSAVAGALSTLACLVAIGLLALALARTLRDFPYAWFWQGLVVVPFIAQYELRTRLRSIHESLARHDLDRALARLEPIHATDAVARHENTIAAAALRGMAANACAGIITPAFWLAVFGLPGLAVVATISALQRRLRTRASTGKAAELINMALNYVPARLCAVLFTASSSLTSPSSAARGLERLWYGRKIAGSINRRWPEAALGGILDVRLSAPVASEHTPDAPLTDDGGLRLPNARDLKRGMRLLATTLTLFTIIVGIVAAFV